MIFFHTNFKYMLFKCKQIKYNHNVMYNFFIFLKKFQKMLLPVFDYVHKSGLVKKQPLLKMFVSHRELVGILENGTPEEFRNGMRNHLENHFARLFE